MSEDGTTDHNMTNPSTPPVLPGYEVGRLLGRGGSGEVWRATGPYGDVAVKVLSVGNDGAGRAEWRRLRRHAGPHVVEALDLLADAHGRACLVLRLMEGGSLDAIVSGRGGLTAGECVTALAPVAGVLEGLHDAGCVHGDIAPGNVLFDADGRPALSDLGTSRAVAVEEHPEWITAGFVAPEVVDGDVPTGAADVYSLGALLWFCLVGEPPAAASLRHALDDLVVGQVPGAMHELILACLAQDPAARPAAGEVRRRLSSIERARPVPIEAARRDGEGVDVTCGAITRRLRDEAQRRQQSATRGAATVSSQGRSRSPHGRSRWPSRVLVGAVAVGAMFVGGASFTPMGDSSSTPSARASTAVALAKRQGATPTSAPGVAKATATSEEQRDAPSDKEIDALLACRAKAWNSGSLTALERCLAKGSSALHQDQQSLRTARATHVRYAGIAYRASEAKVTPCIKLSRCVAVTVTTGAYTVHERGRAQTRAERSDRVTLECVRDGKRWRISSWSVR